MRAGVTLQYQDRVGYCASILGTYAFLKPQNLLKMRLLKFTSALRDMSDYPLSRPAVVRVVASYSRLQNDRPDHGRVFPRFSGARSTPGCIVITHYPTPRGHLHQEGPEADYSPQNKTRDKMTLKN